MPSPRKQADAGSYHHGDLRRALLDAALEMLEGGEELSLRAVARRAGVSHAAPYHHFPDRRALVAAVAAEGMLALRDVQTAARARQEGNPAMQLYETGVAYVRFAVSNPARFRLMFSAELTDRGDLPELQAASDAAYGVLIDSMRRVMGPGFPEEEVQLRALSAWSVVHGLAHLILDNQVGAAARDPDEAERIARGVLMRSMPGPPPAGQPPK